MKKPDFKKIAMNVAGAAAGALLSNVLTKAMPDSVKSNQKTLGAIKMVAGAAIPILLDGKVKGMEELVEGASYGLMVDGVFNLLKAFNFGVSGIGEVSELYTEHGRILVPQQTENILAGIGTTQDAYNAFQELQALAVSGDEDINGEEDINGDDDKEAVVSGDEIGDDEIGDDEIGDDEIGDEYE